MKFLKWFSYCQIILFVISISPFLISPLINNAILYSFSKQLYSLQFPSDMVIVEKQSICGKLNGNGDGMDYFACILVKTSASIDTLRTTLDTNDFNPARIGSANDVDFDIVPVYQSMLKSKKIANRSLIFESLKNETDFKDYYALILYDGGYSTFFDIRGG